MRSIEHERTNERLGASGDTHRRQCWGSGDGHHRRFRERCGAGIGTAGGACRADAHRHLEDAAGRRHRAGVGRHAGAQAQRRRSSRSTSTRSSAPSSRCCDGLADVDPLRVATRRSAASTTAPPPRELDQLSIQTAAALIGEEPQYSRLAARLLATYIDKEVAQPGHPLVLASRSPLGHAAGPDRRRHRRASSRPTPASSTTPIDADARPAVRVLRPAHGLRPLPAAPPRDRAGHRDAAVLLPARRLRPGRRRRTRRSSSTG